MVPWREGPIVLQPALLLGAAFVASLSALLWTARGSANPGRSAFMLGLASMMWWTATTLAQVVVPAPEGKILASKLAWLGIASGPVYWGLSLRAYIGAMPAPSRTLMRAVALFGVAVTAAALTTDRHSAIYTGYDVLQTAFGTMVVYKHGWLFWSVIAFLHLNLAYAAGSALKAGWVNAAIYRRQFLGLVVAMLLPWGFNIAGLSTGFTLWGVDPEPFAFTLTGVILAFLMRDGDLFRLAPVAHRVILDILPDPVIVLDAARRIVEANPAAERLLGVRGAAIGRRLSAPASLALYLDGLGADAATADVDVPEIGRAFEVASEPLDGRGRPGARLLVMRDITERRAAEARLAAATAALTERLAQNLDLQRRLQEEAQRDHLTGLYNRRHAHAVVPDLLARAVATASAFSVVVIDLDHFKSFNDRFGHAAGDAALRLFADMLRRDLTGPELGFRWGGEEFLAVLPGVNRAAALERCRHWRASLTGRPLVAAEGRSLMFSAGIACIATAGADLDDLVRAADAALYRAKLMGRDRVVVWEAADSRSSEVGLAETWLPAAAAPAPPGAS